MIGKQCAVSVLLALATGCSSGTMSQVRRATAAPYQPSNCYRRAEVWPETIRRVAVLPMSGLGHDPDASSGLEVIEPILRVEMAKRKLFEITLITKDQLQLWTGRTTWTTEEALPKDFFARIREGVGCDAVWFACLTAYRPYPPLAVGWSLKLVDAQTGTVWWSLDEVFDAGNTAVVHGASSYAKNNLNLPSPLLDEATVLHSPRRFVQYAAWSSLNTLPQR